MYGTLLTNNCQDEVFAEERPPHRKPHSNDNTIQHCRPKPSPSSTAAPIHHDPAHSDVSHQDAQRETLARVHAQGGGRGHVEEGQVPCLPPEPPDTRQKSRMRCLLRRGHPTGSSTPMITPSSTADPSPVRPALLSPSAMTQLREISATRMHRREH